MINLTNNHLKEFPLFSDKNTKLTKLILSRNEIEFLDQGPLLSPFLFSKILSNLTKTYLPFACHRILSPFPFSSLSPLPLISPLLELPKSLVQVTVNTNHLLSFPLPLLHLPRLSVLLLQENKITSIPPDINCMKRLTVLSLKDNGL